MKRFIMFGIATGCIAATVQAPSADVIVSRSVQAIEADWKQAPAYSFVERDVESKHDGTPVVKAYQVMMIEGSQYHRLIAENDVTLPAEKRTLEEQKLRDEIEKRQHESDKERNKRVAKYNKERAQDHAMLINMVDAFTFQIAGEENLNGHDCWVLDATPKPGYRPKDREGKMLTGMKGRLWVDKAQYQWVKVQAEVIKPVTFYGISKVGPGTQVVLEQERVAENIWLPKTFSLRVKASVLGFINEDSSDNETYRDYKPTPTLEALKTP